VSIKKNRRRDWFGFGDGAAWGLVWFAADLFVDYHDLLISRVAGVAGVETTQNVFSTHKRYGISTKP
jgi:hypothetical protein